MVFLSKVISQQHDYNDFALKMQSASFTYLFIYFHNNIFFPFLQKTDECVLWGSDYTLISRVSGCCSCGVFFFLLCLRLLFQVTFLQLAFCWNTKTCTVSYLYFCLFALFSLQGEGSRNSRRKDDRRSGDKKHHSQGWLLLGMPSVFHFSTAVHLSVPYVSEQYCLLSLCVVVLQVSVALNAVQIFCKLAQ